ncbi:phasin family protein [Leptolyngbya sp. 15MV]|nr:phasin family protein [Leptolyngbya sp. 15MV]
MATQPESKIDAAAEKAYAEASAAKKAEAVKVEAAAPAAATAPVAAPKKAVARKAAPKTAIKKKVAAKAPAKKTVLKKAPVKKAAAKASTPAAKAAQLKDTIMTKAKTTATDFTAQLKEGVATAQERAKAAYDKGTELATEMGEFSKGNLEAVVESGKILTAGVQTIAKTQFEDGKTAVETMTADLKEMASVKSPTEFVQLQGKLASRNFDAAVAQVSKTTEAWVKLANDVFAPLSSRASLAMEKVRKAA